MHFDGCLETKPSESNLTSEFIKCYYDFDHHEIYGQKGLKKVETLPFRVTEIPTGRTTFTGQPWGSGVRANTFATNAVPSPTAEHPVFRGARVHTGCTVAVLAGPASPAYAFATVTVAIICKTKCPVFLRVKTSFKFLGPSFLFAFKHRQNDRRKKWEKKWVWMARKRQWEEMFYGICFASCVYLLTWPLNWRPTWLPDVILKRIHSQMKGDICSHNILF